MTNSVSRITHLLRQYQEECTSLGGPRWQEINDICNGLGRIINPPAVIDMVLHCPSCGVQHIDRPDPPDLLQRPLVALNRWTNPPHKSHLCRKEDGGCGHIWRPAEVPTNGVQAVTPGKDDSPLVPPLPADGLLVRVGSNREISSSQHYRSGAIQITTKLIQPRRR